MAKQKTIQELSADTSLLVEKLRSLKIDETISYSDLSKAISRDVQLGGGRSHLQSARHIVRRDYGIVLATVPKVGVKRLGYAAIVATSDDSMSRIHRESKRGLARLRCVVDIEQLDNGSKVKLNAALAGLGALHEVTKSRSITRLEGVVEKTACQTLPIADTLKAFIGG